MDFSNIPLFSLMKARLNYASERQGILAQNIANADTPGYKAKDVAEPDFKRMLKTAGGGQQGLHMMMTNPRHMTQSNGSPSAFKVIKRATTDEQNPDGNNVAIEEEMSKVASNQADYTKMLNMYSKAIAMFKTAIGNPNTGS